jgi:hypothetical protein
MNRANRQIVCRDWPAAKSSDNRQTGTPIRQNGSMLHRAINIVKVVMAIGAGIAMRLIE